MKILKIYWITPFYQKNLKTTTTTQYFVKKYKINYQIYEELRCKLFHSSSHAIPDFTNWTNLINPIRKEMKEVDFSISLLNIFFYFCDLLKNFFAVLLKIWKILATVYNSSSFHEIIFYPYFRIKSSRKKIFRDTSRFYYGTICISVSKWIPGNETSVFVNGIHR